MNKAELIDNISKLSRQTKTEVEKSLEAFIEIVSKSISSDEEVKLIGFGTFGVAVWLCLHSRWQDDHKKG